MMKFQILQKTWQKDKVTMCYVLVPIFVSSNSTLKIEFCLGHVIKSTETYHTQNTSTRKALNFQLFPIELSWIFIDGTTEFSHLFKSIVFFLFADGQTIWKVSLRIMAFTFLVSMLSLIQMCQLVVACHQALHWKSRHWFFWNQLRISSVTSEFFAKFD